MISAVCFGTNDLARAGEFYDRVLATLGVIRLKANDIEIGYGTAGGSPAFWVLKPYDGKSATHGNGSQVIFEAPNQEAVDQFHKVAIATGGVDEGAPGARDYSPGYYGAYCRDLDGNKLHVYIIRDRF